MMKMNWNGVADSLDICHMTKLVSKVCRCDLALKYEIVVKANQITTTLAVCTSKHGRNKNSGYELMLKHSRHFRKLVTGKTADFAIVWEWIKSQIIRRQTHSGRLVKNTARKMTADAAVSQ